MVLAYVLINTESGCKESSFKRIVEVDSVKEAYICSGVYDIMAVIQYDNIGRMREEVLQIQKINNVRSTLTLVTTS